MIAPNIILIRRNMIVHKLRRGGALSESTAMTLAEAGVRNPGGFMHITDFLVRKGIILRTSDGRYYF